MEEKRITQRGRKRGERSGGEMSGEEMCKSSHRYLSLFHRTKLPLDIQPTSVVSPGSRNVATLMRALAFIKLSF